MPWHGKSSPPAGWQNQEYRLTSKDYVRMILEIADALGLDQPVVMGCSIGGHFPMSEDPDRFASYLLPVLARIRDATPDAPSTA